MGDDPMALLGLEGALKHYYYVNIPATCRCCCRLTCSNSAADAIAPAAGLLHPHSTVPTSPTLLAALAQLPASAPRNLTMPAGLLLQCVG
jgi:hypothetical protein